MELFIGNLAHNVTLSEVIAFFKGFSSKGTFRIEERKLDNGEEIKFAVAEFDNDKLALKMIDKYTGTQLHGQELVIREYFYRSYTNERRAVNWREKPWRAGERRRHDRRIKDEVAVRDEFEEILAASKKKKESVDDMVEHVKISGYRDLAKKS